MGNRVERGLVQGGAGQALLLIVLALPLFFSVAAVVVDGTNLMVNKRQMQNAADAIALAAAQSLVPADPLNPQQGECRGDYPPAPAPSCLDVLDQYKLDNGVSYALDPCTDDPTNPTKDPCFRAPYVDKTGASHVGLIEVRLKEPVSGFFAKLVGISSIFDVAARAVASTTPQTIVNPGSTITSSTPEIVDTIVGADSTSTSFTTITTTIPGEGTYAYTASTACDSITLTHGEENFQAGGLWSNGGISASGAANSATKINWTAPGGCSFPSGKFKDPSGNNLSPTVVPQRANGRGVGIITAQADPTHITVDLVTNFAVGQTIWIGAGGLTRSIATISGSTLTLSSALPTQTIGTVVTNINFPISLPDVIPYSCTSGNVTVDSGWLGSHSPGQYCFTGVITLKASFTGYTFISTSTNGQAIKCTDNGLTFIAPGADPKSSVLLYAVHGGIVMTPGNGVTTKGRMFAPTGEVRYTGGSNVQEGFIMAQTMTINNGPTTFVGSGPDGTATTTTTTVPTATTTYPGSTTLVTTPGSTSTTTTPAQTVTTGTTIGLGE